MSLPNLPVTQIQLRRDNWSGSAYFAWIAASSYPELSQSYKRFLHPEESDRYEAMRFPRRKTSFLLGRYAAKKALSRYFNEPDLSSIAVLSGIFGQPVVHYPSSDSAILTISHTSYAACAIASPGIHPMGLDIESIDEANTHAMTSQMTSNELSTCLDPTQSDITGLTVMWSAKEALSKILMCGLTCPFQILAISSLRRNETGYEGEYLNFNQYKFQSWISATVVCTIAFPRRTQIEVATQRFLTEHPYPSPSQRAQHRG